MKCNRQAPTHRQAVYDCDRILVLKGLTLCIQHGAPFENTVFIIRFAVTDRCICSYKFKLALIVAKPQMNAAQVIKLCRNGNAENAALTAIDTFK